MHTQHVRIKENAHLVNHDLCDGHLDKFQFGTTSFATMEEAAIMLQRLFL